MDPERQGGTLYTPRRRRWRWRRWLPWIVVLGLGAAAAIYFREQIVDLYHEHVRDQVRVRIRPWPAGAEVRVDGVRVVGDTLLLPRSNRTHLVRIRAKGYRTEAFHLRATWSQTYHIVLRERAAGPARSGAARRRGGGGCPRGMRRIARQDDEGFCIDRHEYPGRGKVPLHGVDLQRARAACHARGARLCTVEEWLRACGERFPYAGRYDAERCNTGGSRLLPSGSRPGCRSRWGVYDLSGNASEWVESGVSLGGDARQTGGMVSCRASSDEAGPFTGFRCCADLPWE